MPENDVLKYILARLGTCGDCQTNFGVDDVSNWFVGAVEILIANGILQKTCSATTTGCKGCEEYCDMPVQILPKEKRQPARAFIVCDKRDDVGCISVDLSNLKQWQISGGLLANTLSALLNLIVVPLKSRDVNHWILGMLKGKKHSDYPVLSIENGVFLKIAGHDLPLIEILALKDGKLLLDKKELIKRVDKPIKKLRMRRILL